MSAVDRLEAALDANRHRLGLPALDRSEVEPIPKAPPRATPHQKRRASRTTRSRARGCEAVDEYGPLITRHDPAHRCLGSADEGHHRRPRSAQGAEDVLVNIVALCFACHRWVTAHPREAQRLHLPDGRALLVLSSYHQPSRPREFELLGRVTALDVIGLAFADADSDPALVAVDYLTRAGFSLDRRTGRSR